MARFYVPSPAPWRPIPHAGGMPLRAADRRNHTGGRSYPWFGLYVAVTRCTIAGIRKTPKRVAITAPGRAIRGRSQSLVDSTARVFQGMCAWAGDRRRCGAIAAADAMSKGRQVRPRSGQPSARSLVHLPSAMVVHARMPAEPIPGQPMIAVASRLSAPLHAVVVAGRARHNPVQGR